MSATLKMFIWLFTYSQIQSIHVNSNPIMNQVEKITNTFKASYQSGSNGGVKVLYIVLIVLFLLVLCCCCCSVCFDDDELEELLSDDDEDDVLFERSRRKPPKRRLVLRPCRRTKLI